MKQLWFFAVIEQEQFASLVTAYHSAIVATLQCTTTVQHNTSEDVWPVIRLPS